VVRRSERRPRQENNVNRKTSLLAVALTAIAAASTGPAVAAAPALRADVTDGVLRISGAQFAEKIALRLSALDRNQLQVDVGDDGAADFTFALATFEAIDVQSGNGDDTVRIDQLNGAFTTTKPTRINGENGDDTLIGGSGAEVFIAGNGDDFVDGNGGADAALLGRGDDTFVWDPGDASDVVEGGSGADTMVFNGAAGNEIMAATADGGRVLFTRNLGAIVMDLNDVEVIDVRALGGTDTITVNDVGGTDLDRVNVDLAAALGGSTADGQADTVTVIGTTGDDSITADANGAAVEVSGLAASVRITHIDAAVDTLAIDTLSGDDTVKVDPAVAGLIVVAVQ
jgi:Ca2+-binding RTX toxin-like protein